MRLNFMHGSSINNDDLEEVSLDKNFLDLKKYNTIGLYYAIQYNTIPNNSSVEF